MEERVSSVPGEYDRHDAELEPERAPSDENAVSKPSEPPPKAGVYVVRIPKDQVYRVPPPENALIVERHRNPAPRKRSSCSCCLCIVVPMLLILGLVIGLYAAVSYVFVLRSKEPTFHMERVLVKNNTKSRKTGYPVYDVKFKSENPNSQTILSFQSGGDAYLSYKHDKIGYGNPPEYKLDSKKSEFFSISLDGKKFKLPADIKGNIGDKAQKGKIPMTLTVNIPMTVKSGWMKSEGSTLSVICNFTVDSLSKNSRILSQECLVRS